MKFTITTWLVGALVLGALSGCETDACSFCEGTGMDAGRDAAVLDAMQTDGSLVLLDALVPSDAGVQGDAERDASQSLAAKVAVLTTSRAKWRELSAAMPGPYWYAEENCGRPSFQGSRTIIQVASGVAQVSEKIALARCSGLVNRLTDIRPGPWWETDPLGDVPETMEQLYDVCEATLRRIPLVQLELDTRGVIKACYGDEPGCADGCGAGFNLRDWQFGFVTPTPDAGVSTDSGVVDSGVAPDAGS